MTAPDSTPPGAAPAHVCPAMVPSAKVLLVAFYGWLDRQPHETMADEFWTAERLIDQFILECQ